MAPSSSLRRLLPRREGGPRRRCSRGTAPPARRTRPRPRGGTTGAHSAPRVNRRPRCTAAPAGAPGAAASPWAEEIQRLAESARTSCSSDSCSVCGSGTASLIRPRWQMSRPLSRGPVRRLQLRRHWRLQSQTNLKAAGLPMNLLGPSELALRPSLCKKKTLMYLKPVPRQHGRGS